MASPKVPKPRVRKFLEDCATGDAVAIAAGDVIVSQRCSGGVRVILCERGSWREFGRGHSMVVRLTEPVLEVLRIGVEYYASLSSPSGVEVDPLRGASDEQPSLGGTAPPAAGAAA